MTTDLWLISDLHLYHANMLRGGKIAIRPFDTIDEMHERIVDGWNSVVKPTDKVYMLGDLTLRREKGIDRIAQLLLDVRRITDKLHGQKRLLRGNHDHMCDDFYKACGFERVLAYRELGGYLLSHIPVHPAQFHRYKGNVHGHLHENHVIRHGPLYDLDGQSEIDTRYLNVCVEPMNYVPIHFEEAKRRITH